MLRVLYLHAAEGLSGTIEVAQWGFGRDAFFRVFCHKVVGGSDGSERVEWLRQIIHEREDLVKFLQIHSRVLIREETQGADGCGLL